MRRSPLVTWRKPRETAAMSGQRTPWTGPMPGATRCWPSRYSGSARATSPRRRAAANASGSWVSSASSAPRASACGLVGLHEGHRAFGDRARRAHEASPRASMGSTLSGVSASTGRTAEAVGGSRALACERRSAATYRPVASARIVPSFAVHDPSRGVDDPAARQGRPPLGADRTPDRDGLPEVDRHPGRHAPVVLADEGPGHDLVEDRAEDPAMGDALPALEPPIEGHGRPRSARLDVHRQTQAARVERAAGEAVVGRELEPFDIAHRLDDDVRRQGSAPCAPRT